MCGPAAGVPTARVRAGMGGDGRTVPEAPIGSGMVGGVRAPQGTVPDRSAVSRGRATKTVHCLSPLAGARPPLATRHARYARPVGPA